MNSLRNWRYLLGLVMFFPKSIMGLFIITDPEEEARQAKLSGLEEIHLKQTISESVLKESLEDFIEQFPEFAGVDLRRTDTSTDFKIEGRVIHIGDWSVTRNESGEFEFTYPFDFGVDGPNRYIEITAEAKLRKVGTTVRRVGKRTTRIEKYLYVFTFAEITEDAFIYLM